MTTAIQQNRGSFSPANLLMTGAAVNLLLGPAAALAAVVASIVLPFMANTSHGSYVSFDEKGFSNLTEPWKEFGLQFVQGQILIGSFLKLTGTRINQLAIYWIKSNLTTPFKTLFCYYRVAIMAPLVEEVVFRGFLQDRIRDLQTLAFGAKAVATKVHTMIRVVIQAVIFGLAHYHPLQGTFNIIVVGLTGLVGFYCGLMKEDTGTIAESISLHSLVNTSVITRIWLLGA